MPVIRGGDILCVGEGGDGAARSLTAEIINNQRPLTATTIGVPLAPRPRSNAAPGLRRRAAMRRCVQRSLSNERLRVCVG